MYFLLHHISALKSDGYFLFTEDFNTFSGLNIHSNNKVFIKVFELPDYFAVPIKTCSKDAYFLYGTILSKLKIFEHYSARPIQC